MNAYHNKRAYINVGNWICHEFAFLQQLQTTSVLYNTYPKSDIKCYRVVADSNANE